LEAGARWVWPTAAGFSNGSHARESVGDASRVVRDRCLYSRPGETRLKAGKATLSVGTQNAAVPVAVFGGRLLAPMILRRIEAAGGGLRFAGLLNDTVAAGSTIEGDTVLGPFAAWSKLPADTQFVAPLHKAKEMAARAALVSRLGVPEARWATVVDPQSVIGPNVTIGAGGLVAPCAVVVPSTKIGRHVAIRQGVSIGHDVAIGDWCMLAANASIGGRTRIGEGAYVGMGATVREDSCIGRWSVVGMGAVVLHDVPDFAIVVGNPARIVGETPRP
jgi:sugar O-acyltransferase (sialic acid O-acetyltransferase NeuD family)